MRKNTKKHTIFKKYHHNLLWPSLVISVILMRGYHTPLSHTLTHSLILSSCTMNVSIKVDVSTAEEVSVTVDIILTHQTVHVSWPQERHKVDIGDRSDGHGWVSWWSLMTLYGHWWSWSSVRSHGHRWKVMVIGSMSSSWMMVNERKAIYDSHGHGWEDLNSHGWEVMGEKSSDQTWWSWVIVMDDGRMW